MGGFQLMQILNHFDAVVVFVKNYSYWLWPYCERLKEGFCMLKSGPRTRPKKFLNYFILNTYHNGLCQYCLTLNKSGMTPWGYMSFFTIQL